jgi:hypothetical protein
LAGWGRFWSAGFCEGWAQVGVWSEDGLGLCVAVDLPGEHRKGVLGESEVVESFSGVVVVDRSVGGFSGCSQWLLDVFKYGIAFREGSEMLRSVVTGQLVLCCLVEADTYIAEQAAKQGQEEHHVAGVQTGL